MAGDLHTHSTFSDGSVPIERLPVLARAAGLSHLAVTDHDTLQSVRFARSFQAEGLTLIPGVELTAKDFERGRSVHLLCYFPQETAELAAFCRKMKRRRNAATAESAQRVKELFPAFTTRAAWRYSADSGVLYKTSIIRVLYDYAYTDGIYRELYRQLFGKNGSCRVDPAYDDVYDVLAMIGRAGGVTVFAHPSVYESMELCEECARRQLVDGVEVNHPRNTAGDRVALLNLAQQYELIVTGGTDFHGMNMAKPFPVGAYTTSEGQIQRLLNAARQKRKNMTKPL
ncbi:MAG: PHP domain-containing protein [Oscillospiraceae bacterium]|nr:PHP domain-containing protein [Oscillospiraceae bacterium]